MKQDFNRQASSNKLKRLIRREHLVLTLLTLVCLVLLFHFVPFNTSYRLNHAEALVAQLYQDKDFVFLNEKLDSGDLKRAQGAVKRLVGEPRYQWQRILDQGKAKFKIQADLFSLYQKPNLTQLREGQAKFKADLSSEQVALLDQDFAWSNSDAMTELLDQAKRQAQADWQTIIGLNQALAKLEKYRNFDRSQVKEIVQTAVNFNLSLKKVAHHPQVDQDQTEFYQFLDQFIDKLAKEHQQKVFTKAEILDIFDIDYAAQKLNDTDLDIRPKIALTFDDGPALDTTDQALAILDKYHVKATFFMVGRSVELYPDIAQRVAKAGHEIGNHSYDHPDFAKISDQAVLDQINKTQAIIQKVTGVTPRYYRMPYGSGGKRVYQLIPDLTSITWNTDTMDWKFAEGQLIYDQIMSQLSDDMLVLFHDSHQASIDALGMFVPALVERHYKFVDPTELEFDFRY
ncbi:polysaccharide deacetylase family protein [Eremococcus coleocola]|uniref:Polysaccharide deacetylase n=1 Tax=Eremococcus coleocola ACS-139-V-Col8 TaxID=908337 RepID=E4KPS5_9LACT|nr:polysaccharide deacetylase family protein [Eremococcus coleocola]EFR31182.1 polysaccharide deacetylase [Eremococcus coleocola ACS-139-V-Col8]